MKVDLLTISPFLKFLENYTAKKEVDEVLPSVEAKFPLRQTSPGGGD